MNSTDEKMMNETESMSPKMDNQFFGPMSMNPEKQPECLLMGLIKNQKIVLEEELNEAKLRFADVSLEEENWSGKYERKVVCKVLEGKISILSKVIRDYENMMTPSHKEMAMAV